MKSKVSKDPDMENVMAALLRAAKRARKIAQQTGTAIVVMRNGKLIREFPKSDDQDVAARPSA